MQSGVIFEIGSLIFIGQLIVSYFAKSFSMKLNNKVYKYLLMDQVIMLFFEILNPIVFENFNNVVFHIILKCTWATGIVFFYFLYLYSYIFINGTYLKNIKELIQSNIEVKIYSIFTLVFAIAFIFMPFKDMTSANYTYLPGFAAYAVVCYSALSSLMIIKNIVVKKDLSRRSKLAILSLLSLFLIIMPLQLVFQRILFIGIGTSLQLFILYFIIENPDLILIEEIDMLKLQVERSSKAKSDFLANMSHEIRSPMNAIIGFSETILSDEGPYDKNRTLNDISHIKSSSKNLLDIINNILDISKIETSTDTIENKEYSIATHIIDWSGIVETRLENKNIKFILEVDNTIPSKLYGDATKIFQVVLNLLTNAVKYTEVGRIKMSIVNEQTSRDTTTLKFKVADTGFGIKEEDFDKVFQKFSRLDSAKTNEIEGTGLGLVLTKKYAELMGGDIWFESEYGAGSTFYFNVPQKVIDPTPLGNISDQAEDVANKALLDCSKFKALIIDDDELNIKVTERILSEYKFQIETLSDSKECINKFKMEEHFDIIFLDHVMPGVDGVELVHAIKAFKGMYYVPPVIALTANAITGVRQFYLKEGFDEYLSKPIDVNELDRVINKFFKDDISYKG